MSERLKVGDLVWYVERTFDSGETDAVERNYVRSRRVTVSGPKTCKVGDRVYRWLGDRYQPLLFRTPEAALENFRGQYARQRETAIRRVAESEQVMREIDSGVYEIIQPKERE